MIRISETASHTNRQNELGAQHDKIAKYVGYAGAGAGVAGLGAVAVAKGKAIVAKHRSTAKGHTKAVAKRDTWKREMNSAFKGTQYDASGSIKWRKRK